MSASKNDPQHRGDSVGVSSRVADITKPTGSLRHDRFAHAKWEGAGHA